MTKDVFMKLIGIEINVKVLIIHEISFKTQWNSAQNKQARNTRC